MSALSMAVTCPTCDGHVHVVNESRPIPTELTIILECRSCGVEHALNMRLFPVGPTAVSTLCGTYEGVVAHQRNGTPMCPRCKGKLTQIKRTRRALIGATA
jgi:uncharacterized protein YbaR (Trm112 family)